MSAPAIRLLTPEAVPQFQVWCSEPRGKRALDTETTGLDQFAPGFRVTHLAYGASDGTAWVVDGRDRDLIRASLQAAVASGARWWAHNAAYDALALSQAFGARLRQLGCSMIMSRLLAPSDRRGDRVSLKDLRPATERALTALRRRWAQFTGKPVTDKGTRWLPVACSTLPADDPALLAYVAGDAIECARLVASWAECTSTELQSLVMRECQVDDLWRWVGERGHLVNLPLLAEEEKLLAEAQALCLDRFGLDLSSNSDATRRWLAERSIYIRDRDGNATLSADYYQSAIVPPEAAEDWAGFLEVRATSQVANKLGELRNAVDPEGRVHPSIIGFGAHTGRMAIKRPALQNLPRRLRGLLVAEPGHVLVGCDLDRVEPRVTAALSGDVKLIDAVVNSDVYTELAVSVWGEQARGVEEQRDVAKTAFLALVYGQGPPALADRLGLATSTEAKELIDGILDAYPGMRAWMNSLKASARRGEQLYSGFGRPLSPAHQASFKVVNWVVQGTAADLFKLITLNVVDAIGAEALWLAVHDELILQVPEDREDEALEVLATRMRTDIRGVPISGTPKSLGSVWAKA